MYRSENWHQQFKWCFNDSDFECFCDVGFASDGQRLSECFNACVIV